MANLSGTFCNVLLDDGRFDPHTRYRFRPARHRTVARRRCERRGRSVSCTPPGFAITETRLKLLNPLKSVVELLLDCAAVCHEEHMQAQSDRQHGPNTGRLRALICSGFAGPK